MNNKLLQKRINIIFSVTLEKTSNGIYKILDQVYGVSRTQVSNG